MTIPSHEQRFICDRMAGTLCRHLRLMGYDTLSANDLPIGNRREDTLLLKKASEEHRIILTRDADLARRDSSRVLYLTTEKIGDQIRQLLVADLIFPALRLTRCSLCNSMLMRISPDDLFDLETKIPDFHPGEEPVFWCAHCRKAYWEGSHTSSMRLQIDKIVKEIEITRQAGHSKG